MPKEIADKRRQALLDSIKRSRSEFESLQDEVEEAKNRYYEDVRALHESGMSIRDIAAHVGVSHQRVHQILGKERPKRRRNISKRLGAAGIIIAIALGVAAMLDQPPPPPRPQRVTLIQQPSITRNDARDIQRFEEAIASGRVRGERWRYLFAHLDGKYCSRFRWSSGPARQGQMCGALPPRDAEISEDMITTSFNPVAKNDYHPVGVFHGIIKSADVSNVEVTDCGGRAIETKVARIPDAEMIAFYAFLPDDVRSVNLTAENLRGDKVVTLKGRGCG